VYSPERAKDIVWLSGLVTYEQASKILERIGRLPTPPASIWRLSQAYGERLQEQVAHQAELVSVERVVLPTCKQDHGQRKGISMDGGMVHIRDEGWKELKVGTVFNIEMHLEFDDEADEWAEIAHGANVEYAAVLGTPEEFAPALWATAVNHDVPEAEESSVTADGASWIWNLATDLFPDSQQIIDWYHACEHLAAAAHALYPEDETAADKWYDKRKDDLYQGDIHRITQPLDHSELFAHSGYFHNHQRRMQYHQFRDEGYPIGSGTVESGIKQFKWRLSGPGMRWSRDGAERMIVIRSAILSNTFDDLWQAVA